MCSIMIAEDNMDIISFYQKFLAKEKNIEIVGIANDVKVTLQMYQELNPDLLILDLGLPKIDGLNIINQLCLLETKEKKCNIIVVTGDSNLRCNLFNTKKVYRIIPKVEITTTLLSVINEFINENSINDFPTKKLTNLLLKLNLNPYSKSCSYLIDCITLAYDNKQLLDNIQKIYDIIAIRSNCSSEKIKSSIRSSIRTVNRLACSELLCSIFFISKYDHNKIISPKYFISCIVYFLSNNS